MLFILVGCNKEEVVVNDVKIKEEEKIENKKDLMYDRIESLDKKVVLDFVEGSIIQEDYDREIILSYKTDYDNLITNNKIISLKFGDNEFIKGFVKVSNFKFFKNQEKVFFSVEYNEMITTQILYMYDIKDKKISKVGNYRFITNSSLSDSIYGFTKNNYFYQCIFDGNKSYSITINDEKLNIIKEIKGEIKLTSGEYDNIISECYYNKGADSIKYIINGEKKEYKVTLGYSKIIGGYYSSIKNGKLEEAYSMKYKPNISFEEFKKQYTFDGKVNINIGNYKKV